MSEINFGAIATEWNRGGARRAVAELDRQGYQIVPKEPTAEMFNAAYDVTGTLDDVCRAMLAAAPKVTK